jgi:ribonuclease HI
MPSKETQRTLFPSREEVIIYTDGGCEPNPGKGGYGVVLLRGGRRDELSEGFQRTTNNRMEILAAIKGLEALDGVCDVTLYSDSKYLINGITKGWARKWRAKGWMRTDTEKAKNADLWARMLRLVEQHKIAFVWVRGHTGNEGNERCDALATEAMGGTLLVDEGYVPEPQAAAGAVTSKGPQGEIPLSQRPTLLEGIRCKVCDGALERRIPKRKAPKPGSYYYAYYHRCTGCERMFMPEEAKRYWT